MSKRYFLLGDMPEFIVEKKVKKKDYDTKIKGFLKRVKKVFLYQKREEAEDES